MFWKKEGCFHVYKESFLCFKSFQPFRWVKHKRDMYCVYILCFTMTSRHKLKLVAAMLVGSSVPRWRPVIRSAQSKWLQLRNNSYYFAIRICGITWNSCQEDTWRKLAWLEWIHFNFWGEMYCGMSSSRGCRSFLLFCPRYKLLYGMQAYN